MGKKQNIKSLTKTFKSISVASTSCDHNCNNNFTSFAGCEPYDTKETYDGVSEKFDDDGTLISKSSYIKGKLHGIQTLYFANGCIKQQSTYSKGNLNGSF